MLSLRALQCFIFNIQFGNFLGALPFTFDVKKMRLVPLPLAKRYKAYICYLTYYIAYSYFTTILIYYTSTDRKSYEWNLCFLIVSTGICGIICTFVILAFLDDLCATTTMLLKFMVDFEAQYFHKNIKNTTGKFTEIILILGNVVNVFYPMVVFTAYTQMYHIPPLPYGTLPEKYRHISVAVAFGIIIIWALWNMWAIAIFMMNISVIFARVFETVGREIRFGKPHYKTNSIARSPDAVIRTITSLRLIFARHEHILQAAMAPFQIVVTRSVIVTVYVIVTYFDTMDSSYLSTNLNAIVAVSGSWCVILKGLAGISRSLNACFHSLYMYHSKSADEMKYMRMQRKSFKLVAYRIGDVSKISKTSVPKFILSVSRGALKLIMSSQ